MKRLLLSAVVFGFGFSAWSLNAAPMDILAPEVRDGIAQEQQAEVAATRVLAARAAVNASALERGGQASVEALAELDNATMAFLDVSTVAQNAVVFGSGDFASADADSNVEAMIHAASLVSGMNCNPDPTKDVVIHVHTSATPYNPRNPSAGGQYLVASYPDGESLGPIPISSAGWTRDINHVVKLFKTPTGCYHGVTPMAVAYSAKYQNSPMPHALFFLGMLYAIHGTMEEGHLGHTASHGCVRISKANAGKLYAEVENVGATNTYVIITR